MYEEEDAGPLPLLIPTPLQARPLPQLIGLAPEKH